MKLFQLAQAILRNEPNVLRLTDPISIIGDIHGQLYDMEKIIGAAGDPGEGKYLFLGDYVDRGAWSTEVIIVVLALKVALPDSVFLLRGNHETRMCTTSYGFRQECVMKYDIEVYATLMNVFDSLPLAAVIGKDYFCVHGGISPKIVYIDDFNKENRFSEIKDDSWTADVVWADPVNSESGEQKHLFIVNKNRNISVVFGADALDIFLRKNKMKTLIRAHEVFFEGFKALNWKSKDAWQIVTVFSAPNYTDLYKNLGAVLLLKVFSSERQTRNQTVSLGA